MFKYVASIIISAAILYCGLFVDVPRSGDPEALKAVVCWPLFDNCYTMDANKVSAPAFSYVSFIYTQDSVIAKVPNREFRVKIKDWEDLNSTIFNFNFVAHTEEWGDSQFVAYNELVQDIYYEQLSGNHVSMENEAYSIIKREIVAGNFNSTTLLVLPDSIMKPFFRAAEARLDSIYSYLDLEFRVGAKLVTEEN